MSSKAALFPIVYNYLKAQGLDSTAKKLLKEAKLDSTDASKTQGNLLTMYETYTKSEAEAKAAAAKAAAAAAAAAAKAAGSSSSSSSSESDSDDHTDSAKAKTAPVKKVDKKDSSSSSSSSDSDSSDDEEEAPAKKAVVTKPKPVAKSSSSSDSDSSDDEEEAPAKKAVVAKPVAKKAAKADSSSSDSSSSDSDSDDEDVEMKPPPAPVAKAAAPAAAKSSSSSSSGSDSDSDDEMVVHKRKREEDSAASTPAKKAKATGSSTPSGDPAAVRVSGMPYETTEADIKNFFKDCGEIKEIDMPLWEDSGRSKGFANLTFESTDAAQKCIAMNNATMGERWLKIESYVEKPKRTYDNTPSAKPEGCTCVFVGNLSYDIDEESMKAAFKDCGEVTNIRWGMDRDSGDFKGYGHVEFATTEATDKAVAMAGEMILGRAIRVDFAKGRTNSPSRSGGKSSRSYGPESEKPSGCKTLFIGNLSFNIDEDSVWTEFGKCGEVIRVKLATDRETGEYRGFGHVEFADSDSADKAVKELAGKKIAGREVRIDWAKGRD
jgi:nucleolin